MMSPNEPPPADLSLDYRHTSRLLEEFQELPIVAWLVQAIKHIDLDPESLVDFLDLSKRLRYLVKEERPISTGFALGVPEDAIEKLNQASLKVSNPLGLSVKNSAEFVDVACLVDGSRQVVLVDRSGRARGVSRLDELRPADQGPLCAPRYLGHCVLCSQAKSLVFVFLGGGVINVFWEHGQILRHDARGWRFRNSQEIEPLLTGLAGTQRIDADVLRTLFCLALEMSDRHTGGIFIIGDEDSVLTHTDPSRLPAFLSVENASLLGGRLDELERYAQQDGAVVLDASGCIKRIMAHLRPPQGAAVSVKPGVGLRHTSAAGITSITAAVAIVVSQDGPVSIYAGGQTVLEI